MRILNGTLQGSTSIHQTIFSRTVQIYGSTPENTEYPYGTIYFNGVRVTAYSQSGYIRVYLGSAGDNYLLTSLYFEGSSHGGQAETKTLGGYSVNAPLTSADNLRIIFVSSLSGATEYDISSGDVSIQVETLSIPITLQAGTGGSLSASRNSAPRFTSVTLYPVASTGYRFTGYTAYINKNWDGYTWLSASGLISGNSFQTNTYPVKVVANFELIPYTVSVASSPSGAGSVSSNKATATMGETVTVSQTPGNGYYFNGWSSSPSVSINGSGQFTMPASAVTITARYLRRSTAGVNSSAMYGGSSYTLTINTESTAYSHAYQLSFGSGMATSVTSVAAGTTSVTIAVPLNWSASIPNATTKTGGTLTVWTYNGGTQIGSYTITGLTYYVPASVAPTLTDITTSIVRTVGGKTYANVGNYYVQNHSAVRIQATASGAQSSTISSVVMSMSGYSGTNYNKTQSAAALDFTSALLTNNGTCTITVTATDSRGRTVSKTTTITVTAYAKPSGTLSVWRVDEGGTADEFGERGQYSLTTGYSQIGSNSITYTLNCNSVTNSNPAASGNLMPTNRLTLSVLQEYTVTLTITDAFETTVVQAKVPSGKFVMHVDNSGNRMGIMKATNKTIPTGKTSTFEIAAGCQVYIGDSTLEDYIRSIVNS